MDFGGEPTTTTLLNSIIPTYICRGIPLRMFECVLLPLLLKKLFWRMA